MTTKRRLLRCARMSAGFFLALAGLNAAWGQHAGADREERVTPASPPSDVSYEQRIGEQLPLDTVLTDETGASRAVGDFFGTTPVVIVFGYFRCPQLCSIVSDATQESLRALRVPPGEAYQFLYVSIDPTDTPVAAKEKKVVDIRRLSRPGSEQAWHYLTGSENSLRRFAEAAGFHYRYDAPSRQYAHASGFLVATPQGSISRYFLGIDYDTKALPAALERAAEGKTGESVYQLLLLCIHGAGVTGRYGPLIWHILQIAVVSTVLGLAWGITRMILEERRQRRLLVHPRKETANTP